MLDIVRNKKQFVTGQQLLVKIGVSHQSQKVYMTVPSLPSHLKQHGPNTEITPGVDGILQSDTGFITS